MKNLSQAAPTDLVMKALDDHDEGVRKLGLATAGRLNRTELADKVASMSQNDPAEHLRSAASMTVEKLK